MRELHPQGMEVLHVHPGDYVAVQRPVIIRTLLGSCVSACLYDAQAGIGGLNHFLLATPTVPLEDDLLLGQAGRYGINAMELLINSMLKQGALRSRLRAKVFGGAKVLGSSTSDDFFRIQDKNKDFVLAFMRTEAIPLDAADLGGERGRVIYFNTGTWEVSLRYIPQSQTRRVEARERAYWQQALPKPNDNQIYFF